jgi:6-pyruvoyltetrahydropterin/6-carboxytetrahydropterin synthase
MYIISVEKHFDAAHFLRGYEGKCEKLHGHRYRVVMRLVCSKLNQAGLAYDFTDLKRQLAKVTERYDHQCLNDIEPFDRINPSAENIASTIYDALKSDLAENTGLDSVEVWESPDSCALYRQG